MTNLNIIWIGKPKFMNGGQDVVGIESIFANIKNFKLENDYKIIFWCQKE